jgi:uncharacterized protein YodC (DUF2158 family)
MSEHKFRVGDTVRLKSGGPSMTVCRVVADDIDSLTVDTIWFTSGGKESKGSFSEEWLEPDDWARFVGKPYSSD